MMALPNQAPGVVFDWGHTTPEDESAFAATDVTAFIGIAARGPVLQPVRVTSWSEFVASFGAEITQGYLAYSVAGFFANGGRAAWIVRVADPALARPARLDLTDSSQVPIVTLQASSPGVWGQAIAATLVHKRTGEFDISLSSGSAMNKRAPNPAGCPAGFTQRRPSRRSPHSSAA